MFLISSGRSSARRHRQQPSPDSRVPRRRTRPCQLAFEHDLIGDLLVLDVELEPADKGVDRVPAGVDHDVAADRVFSLDQQPELHLALLMGPSSV